MCQECPYMEVIEKPFCNAVKVKPSSTWKPQDVRDSRNHGIHAKGSCDREWNQPKRGALQSTKVELELSRVL